MYDFLDHADLTAYNKCELAVGIQSFMTKILHIIIWNWQFINVLHFQVIIV